MEVLPGEAGTERPEVAGAQRPLRRPVTAQQAAREHAVRGDPDTQLAAGRQDPCLDATRQQRVLDLHVGDRMHRMGTPDRLRAGLGEPDVAHVPRLYHLRDGRYGLLDGYRRIHPGRAVDVDVVGAEPAQAVGEEVADRGRPPVGTRPGAGRIAQGAELHAEDHLVAAAPAQRLVQQQLVVAHAVEVAGVEQRHAGVQRGVDRRDALLAICRTVEVGHAHAAQTDSGHAKLLRSQR